MTAPNVQLDAARRLIGRARSQRMLAADHDGARRLARLAELVAEEAEYLDGIEHHGLPVTDRAYPPGACLGWLLRHDAHVRRLRELHGLPIPEVCRVA